MTLPVLALRFSCASLTALVLFILAASASAQQVVDKLPGNDDQSTYFRVDPNAEGRISPITADKMKEGAVYNFYSSKLNRRAWSIYMGNGQFWHAMGPNSVQPIDAFDLEMTKTAAMELLRQRYPEIAKQVSITGENVFLMLENNNEWKLIPRNSVPRILDVETGLEWEKQFGTYMHVIPRGSMLGIGLGCCGW